MILTANETKYDWIKWLEFTTDQQNHGCKKII